MTFRSAAPVTAQSYNVLQPITERAFQQVQNSLALQDQAAARAARQDHDNRVLIASEQRANQRQAMAQQQMAFTQQQAELDRDFQREKFDYSKQMQERAFQNSNRNSDLERGYLQARINAANRSNPAGGGGTLGAGDSVDGLLAMAQDPNMDEATFYEAMARFTAAGENAPAEYAEKIWKRNHPTSSGSGTAAGLPIDPLGIGPRAGREDVVSRNLGYHAINQGRGGDTNDFVRSLDQNQRQDLGSTMALNKFPNTVIDRVLPSQKESKPTDLQIRKAQATLSIPPDTDPFDAAEERARKEAQLTLEAAGMTTPDPVPTTTPDQQSQIDSLFNR